jgi:hypothetical protein
MSTARDHYREYFAERLWDWVPAIYRELDALEGGDSLRALFKAIGSQAALAKRSHDRLWDDMFVELTDDWAVPYIAELVATRLVSALNPRARRADVAKTIYYRRRKGTLAVLEQLVADMSGWDGKVVEEFRRLARMRHGLDGPARLGLVSGTPEGGLADLRSVRGARLAGDPFDELHYTPEMRRPQGRLGLRGIQTLGFHLYRLQSVEFIGVQPRLVNNLAGTRDGFSFDPSGRDVPLFAANTPPRDWVGWRTAGEWELPRAIDCRLLNEAVFVIGDEEIGWILDTSASGAPIANLIDRQNAAAGLRHVVGQRLVGREALRRVLGGLPQAATLTAPGVVAGLIERALVPACGSAALLPDANGNAAFSSPALQVGFLAALPVLRERTRGANLASWPTPLLAGVDLLVDPACGRFLFDTGASDPNDLRVRYRVGMAGPLGAGAFGREIDPTPATVHWAQRSSAAGMPAVGIAEVDDSSTFDTPPNQAAITASTVRAAEGQRPYLRLQANWQLTAAGNNRELSLDGLWIGARPAGNLRLAGNFARVTLRYCTLDPGGLDAMAGVLPPCELVVAGNIDQLVIEHCILPSLRLEGANASIDHIVARDSLIDASRAPSVGIAAPRSLLTMSRCTVIASAIGVLCLDVEKLDATDSLVAGLADVTDLQSGCFRFSARGAGSRVPHPYASHTLSELERVFVSRRFGDPAYATLSPRAPAELLRGSEEGSEIGVFCAERGPIKFDSLRTKVEEYTPFGRLPAYITEN